MTSVVFSSTDITCPSVHPVSQIIARNLHRREACHSGLWINPEKDDCWRKVNITCPTLKLFSQDYGAFSFLQTSGADIQFSAFPQLSADKFSWIILNLPRQKALLNMLLDCAAGLLAKNGLLWLAGENKAGIKSAEKYLEDYFGQVRKLDKARHCTLYEAAGILKQQPFDPLGYRQDWLLDDRLGGLTISSYPGVFAHGRLDPGTALLLDVLADMEVDGDVLDFACGAGVIGAFIAANHPDTRVTLLDTSALALRACEETLTANHLNATILASDGLSEIRESYDLVVSNPPIHTGVKTDSRLGARLLESIHDHIRPGGSLIMVANRHLPYEKWLSQTFRYSSKRAANDSYKVILAKK
jgi:16S rRNA (guanine1207-N2)-methyltransferase